MLLSPIYENEMTTETFLLTQLYKPDGSWRRSPEDSLNQGKFKPSRDQIVMAIVFCLLTGRLNIVKSTLEWLSRSHWRYPSGDVAAGELWLATKRFTVFGYFWEWVPLWVWDLFILFGSLNRLGWLPRYKHDYDFGNGKRGSKWLWKLDPDDVGDDKVHCMQVMLALMIRPTWIAELGAWLYFRKRPAPYIAKDIPYVGLPNCALALYWYFRKESGNNVEIAQEWAEVLRTMNLKI